MKQISLTQGKFALVDDEDYEYLNQWKWYVFKYSYKGVIKAWYAARTERLKSGGKITFLMHRAIMQAKNEEEVDHENNDGLNNQKFNLRKATRQENARNRKKQVNNTSGYKGVFLDKRVSSKPWQARIVLNKNNRIHLGMFVTAEEAAKAYDEAALMYHGDFARLNLEA